MTLLVILAYSGILLASLICLLLADILLSALPSAAGLPILCILCVSMALPMIVARRGKGGP